MWKIFLIFLMRLVSNEWSFHEFWGHFIWILKRLTGVEGTVIESRDLDTCEGSRYLKQ
jgi:hypothetical protein